VAAHRERLAIHTVGSILSGELELLFLTVPISPSLARRQHYRLVVRYQFARDRFDLLPVAFREALKSDRFAQARRAYEMDVLSRLVEDVPEILERQEEVNRKLDEIAELLQEWMRRSASSGEGEEIPGAEPYIPESHASTRRVPNFRKPGLPDAAECISGNRHAFAHLLLPVLHDPDA
jgi:hypothetical protein